MKLSVTAFEAEICDTESIYVTKSRLKTRKKNQKTEIKESFHEFRSKSGFGVEVTATKTKYERRSADIFYVI